MHPIRALTASLLAAVPLAAQTAPQPTAPPVTPHVVIETVGPDGWRARLGPTNVGSMLASEEGRAYWQPGMQQFFGMWQMLVGEEGDFEAARQRLLGFSGSIRLAALFADDGRSPSRTHAALMLIGDGRSDLGALADDVRGLIGRGMRGEWRTAEIGERSLELRDGGDDDLVVSAPVVDGDRMFLLAGPAADVATSMALAQHLEQRPLAIGKPTPDSPALHVRFDMPALLAATGAFDDSEGESMKALGFDSLQNIDITLGAAGPRIAFDVGVSFRSQERGLFAAFMPDHQGVSSLTDLLPAETAAWKVGRFDCEAMFEAIVSAIERAPYWADEPERVRQTAREELGIDLGKDLLAHMHDDVLVVGSPFADFDRAYEATWMFAFRLRDEAKFRQGLDKMLAKLKPWLSPSETTEVGDVQLRRYGNMLRYDLWMAAGNGLYVVAGGRDAEDEAVAILTRAANDQHEPAGNHEAWSGAINSRYLPPGHNGVARFDVDAITGIPVDWWMELLTEVVPMLPVGSRMSPEQAEQQQERFRELLRSHNLTIMRTATGYADAAWHWRLFW